MTTKALRKPSVLLFNMSNIGECPHIALGLQSADMLQKWYTGLYYRPERRLDLAALLPDLKRRNLPELDSAKIETVPVWEAARIAATRAPLLTGRRKRAVAYYCQKSFSKAVARELQRLRPEVVLGVNWTSLEVFEAARELGITTVLSQRIQHPRVMQESVARELDRHGVKQSRFLESRFLQQVERASTEIDIADYVLCPSPSVIQSMHVSGVHGDKLRLVPFGVDTSRFNGVERVPGQKFRVLYVGKIGYRKGIEYLLDAFKEAALPDSELVLIGKIDDLDASRLEQYTHVRHLGWLPPAELTNYYASASVFVLPSISEGSALVSYEAMAAGLPVITTTASGSLVRHGKDGLVVEPGDASAMSHYLKKLYNDSELRTELGENGRQYIQKYSWAYYQQNVAETVAEVWHSRQREGETG